MTITGWRSQDPDQPPPVEGDQLGAPLDRVLVHGQEVDPGRPGGGGRDPRALRVGGRVAAGPGAVRDADPAFDVDALLPDARVAFPSLAQPGYEPGALQLPRVRGAGRELRAQ